MTYLSFYQPDRTSSLCLAATPTGLLWLACVLLALSTPDGYARDLTAAENPTIYACINAQGVPTFTDRGCLLGPRIVLGPVNIIHSPLSETPRSQPRNQPGKRKSDQTPSSKSTAKVQVAAAREACRSAKAGLDALHNQRRRGYRLRDSAMLDKREADLNSQRREHC